MILEGMVLAVTPIAVLGLVKAIQVDQKVKDQDSDIAEIKADVKAIYAHLLSRK